jgi:hypothetical protein
LLFLFKTSIILMSLINLITKYLPSISLLLSRVAYAYVNSWLSVYNDEWCEKLSTQVHGTSSIFNHINQVIVPPFIFGSFDSHCIVLYKRVLFVFLLLLLQKWDITLGWHTPAKMTSHTVTRYVMYSNSHRPDRSSIYF